MTFALREMRLLDLIVVGQHFVETDFYVILLFVIQGLGLGQNYVIQMLLEKAIALHHVPLQFVVMETYSVMKSVMIVSLTPIL